jgi:hypothetical protein
MGKKIVSPILDGQVMYFMQNVIICKVVHTYNMIIFHVPWIFEWWITTYYVIGKFIIA